jgi:hypothetical protein
VIYDLDQERINELTAAFSAGELRGYQRARDEADEDLVAECVALRVKLARREWIEVVSLNVCATLAVLLCWGSLIWLVLG